MATERFAPVPAGRDVVVRNGRPTKWHFPADKLTVDALDLPFGTELGDEPSSVNPAGAAIA